MLFMKSKERAKDEDLKETTAAETEATATAAEADAEFTTDGETAEAVQAEIILDDDSEKSHAPDSTDERDAQIADLTQQLMRARADFDNFRRRTRQEKEDLQQFATKKLLEQLLPVIDNFERALSAVPNSEGAASELISGIEMVHRQLAGVLEQHGVEAIEAVGQPFDPNYHEAVMQESVEGKEPGEVIAELQKGYTIHGKVLRPAMVKVTS